VDDLLVARIAGAAAALAGVAICAASYVESTLPLGCVGDECSSRPQRPDSTTADAWYTLALLMLLMAALGVGLLLLRRRLLGRAGVAAVLLVGIGSVVAVGANVVQSWFFGGDLAAMPALFLPAIAATVAGLALLMVVVVRARLVPLWAGVLVGVTVLLVPFGNQENSTVLLDAPLGLALVVAGVLLCRAGVPPRLTNPTGSRRPRSVSGMERDTGAPRA
jgi:hypothetical protein